MGDSSIILLMVAGVGRVRGECGASAGPKPDGVRVGRLDTRGSGAAWRFRGFRAIRVAPRLDGTALGFDPAPPMTSSWRHIRTTPLPPSKTGVYHKKKSLGWSRSPSITTIYY
jgi:hypothetical protein